MSRSSRNNNPAPPGSPACFVYRPVTPPPTISTSSSSRNRTTTIDSRQPTYAPVHRVLNLYPAYSPMARVTSHEDWQNLQRASWTTNQVMHGAVQGNLHAAINRWVCGSTDNWVPCWSCQLKICDECTRYKTISRPQKSVNHGCEPRCSLCFEDFCRASYAVRRECRDRCSRERQNRPDDEAYLYEDRPREVCPTCVRKSSAELLRLRRSYEVSMGYVQEEEREENGEEQDGVDERRVRCVDCRARMSEGNRMYWSCELCSGRCRDRCHEPMRMVDRRYAR